MLCEQRGRRNAGFTIVSVLIAMATVGILAGILLQGGLWVRKQAEITVLTARASHLDTALQLHYQTLERFPSACPGRLDEDLLPFVDTAEAFVNPALPEEGPEPLNQAYAMPVHGDQNAYVLALDGRLNADKAVALFSDSTVHLADKLPITHNSVEVPARCTVSGGTLTFANGSIVRLAGDTTATIAHSIRVEDGTCFSIVKLPPEQAGSLTAVALDTDIIEVVSDSGISFSRGGVADVDVIPEDAYDLFKVSTRSGEVRVIGKLLDNGQTVEDVVDDPPEFTIDDDQNIVPDEDCIAQIQVLGKAITYGAGGPDCDVQAGAKLGTDDWQWLFDGVPVQGGEVFECELAAGTTVAVKGRASYGSWSRTYNSFDHHQQVLVLLNGDTPPAFDPFDGQPEITEFCEGIVDPATGTITIESHQALILFELGTTNMSSPAADFQDLVLLVDFFALPMGDGSDDDPEPPSVDDYEVTIDDENLITIRQNASLGVRVLGTELQDASGDDIPITLKIRINGDWRRIRRDRAVTPGYLYKRRLNAGKEIALKVLTCNGDESVSYHSADGSGHVPNHVKDEVPEFLEGDGAPEPVEFLLKAVDPATHEVALASNQILMTAELAKEDLEDPEVTFQNIALVLTFTPKALHSQNTNSNNFDGYQESGPDQPMAVGAEAYAEANEFAWYVMRESDIPEEPEDPPDDGGDDDDGDDGGDGDDDDYPGQGEMHGSTCRTLSRGICVLKGRWIKVVSPW